MNLCASLSWAWSSTKIPRIRSRLSNACLAPWSKYLRHCLVSVLLCVWYYFYSSFISKPLKCIVSLTFKYHCFHHLWHLRPAKFFSLFDSLKLGYLRRHYQMWDIIVKNMRNQPFCGWSLYPCLEGNNLGRYPFEPSPSLKRGVFFLTSCYVILFA